MNAAVVHSFDAPPNYATFTDPVANEGEKLVTVIAAGLHPIVKSLARGTHYGSSGELPFVAGIDGVGKLEDGTRVFFGTARTPFGTFSELALAPDWMRLPLPDGIDDVTAAGIVNPAMSSWAALTARAKFVAGESVLILGATGVAGRLAIQIAKRLGARRVVAAGRHPKALEKLSALGADQVIHLDQDRTTLVSAFRRELAEAGIDVVLDYVWGQPAECMLDAISQKGLQKASPRLRFIQIGESAGKTISLAASTLRSSGVELLGSGFGSASLDQIRQSVSEFFQAAATKPFQFETKPSPLREVEAIWNESEEGTRIVFQP
ncbi:MAG TPA: zinc-binding alcohol dehydrogenase family protein [Edaphobacter sp.]|jgi:NADPH:quinone reductase-like Zn-dependent oxidoreductase|nr:zinc-binding alcohol dehydrogenase family protein [Edaphobacter sp.]